MFGIDDGLFSGIKSIFSGGVGNDEDNNENDVIKARDSLAKAGYEAGEKGLGILDKTLDTATKAFQKDNGLKVDGVMKPGGETETTLQTILNRKSGKTSEVKGKDNNFFPVPPKPLKLQSSIGDGRDNKPEDIAALENILTGIGSLKIGDLNKGKGSIRPSIIAATKDFQKKNGLFVDGVIKPDGETQKALNKELQPYFSIIPTKEQREAEERARKQREKPILEQIIDFLDPAGIEEREKRKETPPIIAPEPDKPSLEELAKRGEIMNIVAPNDDVLRDKEEQQAPLVSLLDVFKNDHEPQHSATYELKSSLKNDDSFLGGIGDAISDFFVGEAEAGELPTEEISDKVSDVAEVKTSTDERSSPPLSKEKPMHVKNLPRKKPRLMGSEDLDKEVMDFIQIEEEYKGHLYKDTGGYITTGIGLKVDNEEEMASLPFVMRLENGKERLATEEEKIDYYRALKKIDLGSNVDADSYVPNENNNLPNMYFPEEDARLKMLMHLHEDHRMLRKDLGRVDVDFDKLPKNAKKAIFDIRYNTGNFNENSWEELIKAIKKDDWVTAARESSRIAVSKERNDRTADLFLSIAKEMNGE